MRIVIITGVFIPEPVVSARLLAELAERLAADYKVTILRPHPTRPLGFVPQPLDKSQLPYEIVELDSFTCPQSNIIGRFKESISMGKACCAYLESHKEETGFVYNSPWHLFGRKAVAEWCQKNHVPNMTPVQDIYPESLLSKLPKIGAVQWLVKKLLMPYDLITLRNADKIHTISGKMADYLSKTRKIDGSRFVVVRNWQDEREFVQYKKQHESDEGIVAPFTFMYMGNVGKLAGLATVLDAYAMAEGLENTRLVIAGSGPAKEGLQQKASAIRNRKIEFWEVPFGEVPAIQAKADVMMLPVMKGFASSSIPSKLPAYMFSAKPVLASVDADSDTAMCIKNANAGFVCEPENTLILAKLMHQMANTPKEELEAMGKRGFDYAINDFSRTENLQKLYKAVVEVIESGKK